MGGSEHETSLGMFANCKIILSPPQSQEIRPLTPSAWRRRELPSCQLFLCSLLSFLSTASAVLQSDKTLKDDALVSLSWVLRPLPPAPASLQRPHGKPLPPPSRNALLPLQKPLEFSPFPRTPMIAVYRGCGLKKAGPFNFTAHTRAAERLVEPLLTHSIVLNEVPLIRGVPRVLQRGVQRPTRLLLSAPPLSTFLPAPAGRRSCANDDQMWPQGLCPPAIPPVPPTMPGVNKVPPPHWACGEGGLDILQPKALPDDTCRSASLYENFRHWQHFKTLLRRLLPLTPDVEAVSCFLVCVPSQGPRAPLASPMRGRRRGNRRGGAEKLAGGAANIFALPGYEECLLSGDHYSPLTLPMAFSVVITLMPKTQVREASQGHTSHHLNLGLWQHVMSLSLDFIFLH